MNDDVVKREMFTKTTIIAEVKTPNINIRSSLDCVVLVLLLATSLVPLLGVLFVMIVVVDLLFVRLLQCGYAFVPIIAESINQSINHPPICYV